MKNHCTSILLILGISVIFSQAKRTKVDLKYGLCSKDHYRCENERCIGRNLFCNGHDDCGDDSDEKYCRMFRQSRPGQFTKDKCPSYYEFYQCSDFLLTCIPLIWTCDGVQDCFYGSDETICQNDVEKIDGSINAREKSIEWIKTQLQSPIGHKGWRVDVPRAAIALFLANSSFFNGLDTKGNEIAEEVENEVLGSIKRNKIAGIPMNQLAVYINALLVTCTDPREFHGFDLVKELRHMVDMHFGQISPIVILALCNAGDRMSDIDVGRAINSFWTIQRLFWRSTRAISLMAMACIADRSADTATVSSSAIDPMVHELTKNQFKNGSYENIQITALVTQALFALGREDNHNFDMDKAIKFLIKSQKYDGSCGTFLNNYYTLPILHYKSLVNISSSHCENRPGKDNLFEINKRVSREISVKYSLIHGDQKNLIQSLVIRTLKNSTFFDVMKRAEKMDIKYSFEYYLVGSKPYIHSLGGLENDPENEIFWFLYKMESPNDIINSSPKDVIPKDGEEYAMWYKKGHWLQSSKSVSYMGEKDFQGE